MAIVPARADVQKRAFTLDDLTGENGGIDPWGDLPEILRWAQEGTRYLRQGYDPTTHRPQIVAVAAHTGETTTLFRAETIERAMQIAGAGRPEVADSLKSGANRLDPEVRKLLVRAEGDLWVFDRTTSRATRLTRLGASVPIANESFSPDGRWVAFVRGGNLYVVAADGKAPERALTADGSSLVQNGRLDWVYEEELYGRGNSEGYTWSPDSRRIAFLRIDDTAVRPFPIEDPLSPVPAITEQRYPLAGEANPVATLGVAAVTDPDIPVRFVDMSAYPDQDRLIVRFGWAPDGAKVVCEVQNRVQTRLDLLTADPETGKPVRLLQETTPAWVDVIDLPCWLPDGGFLWQSDRTGWRHLYRYRADGALVGAVTSGDWNVRELYGVDTRHKMIYFSANRRSATSTDVYRMRLDRPGSAERLTTEPGTHVARFDPAYSLFLDTWSSLSAPPQIRLYDAGEGRLLHVIGDNAALINQLKAVRTRLPEPLVVLSREGQPLDAILIRPTDFDPKRRYPVFCDIYGGPDSVRMRDAWKNNEYVWYQMLAQHGYVVWLCEGRLTGDRGIRRQWDAYRTIGAAELRDIEDGLGWLRTQPWVDSSRIALCGWSYGGFLVEYALTHGKTFKAGIAGAGVSDWRLYDSIYTERYLDLPAANPAGYRGCATLGAAANLSGKLLLLHGLADDNVHLQHTLQLIYALERAGKSYDLTLYPSARHGVVDLVLYRHQQQRILDFLEASL